MTSLNSSTTPTSVTSPTHPALVTSLALYFLPLSVGTAGNAGIVYVIASHKALRTGVNAYIANMAALDLMASVLLVPLRVLFYMAQSILGEGGVASVGAVCQAEVFLRGLADGGRMLLLAAVSFERYQAVANPFQRDKAAGVRRALLTLAALWLVMLTYAAVLTVFFQDTVMFEFCMARASSSPSSASASSPFSASPSSPPSASSSSPPSASPPFSASPSPSSSSSTSPSSSARPSASPSLPVSPGSLAWDYELWGGIEIYFVLPLSALTVVVVVVSYALMFRVLYTQRVKMLAHSTAPPSNKVAPAPLPPPAPPPVPAVTVLHVKSRADPALELPSSSTWPSHSAGMTMTTCSVTSKTDPLDHPSSSAGPSAGLTTTAGSSVTAVCVAGSDSQQLADRNVSFPVSSPSRLNHHVQNATGFSKTFRNTLHPPEISRKAKNHNAKHVVETVSNISLTTTNGYHQNSQVVQAHVQSSSSSPVTAGSSLIKVVSRSQQSPVRYQGEGKVSRSVKERHAGHGRRTHCPDSNPRQQLSTSSRTPANTFTQAHPVSADKDEGAASIDVSLARGPQEADGATLHVIPLKTSTGSREHLEQSPTDFDLTKQVIPCSQDEKDSYQSGSSPLNSSSTLAQSAHVESNEGPFTTDNSNENANNLSNLPGQSHDQRTQEGTLEMVDSDLSVQDKTISDTLPLHNVTPSSTYLDHTHLVPVAPLNTGTAVANTGPGTESSEATSSGSDSKKHERKAPSTGPSNPTEVTKGSTVVRGDSVMTDNVTGPRDPSTGASTSTVVQGECVMTDNVTGPSTSTVVQLGEGVTTDNVTGPRDPSTRPSTSTVVQGAGVTTGSVTGPSTSTVVQEECVTTYNVTGPSTSTVVQEECVTTYNVTGPSTSAMVQEECVTTDNVTGPSTSTVVQEECVTTDNVTGPRDPSGTGPSTEGSTKTTSVEGHNSSSKATQVKVVEMDGSAHVEQVSVAQNIQGDVCMFNPRNRVQGRRRVEVRVAKKLVIIFLTFLLLWLPYPLAVLALRLLHLRHWVGEGSGPGGSAPLWLWRSGEDQQTATDVVAVLAALSTVTAAVNPLLYGLANVHIRSAIVTSLRAMCKRCSAAAGTR